MHICKILFLLTVGFISINARTSKRQKRFRQRPISYTSPPSPCSSPISLIEIPCGSRSIIEPTYGSLGTCNCQNIFLDEVSSCSCSELSSYGRVPAIKFPKVIANNAPIPAINLPGLYDFAVELPVAMPYIPELPCQCKAPVATYQFIESPCSCRTQAPIVEYLSPVEIASPILTAPYADSCYLQVPKCKSQPQIIEMRSCGYQNTPCGYQNGINTLSGCDNGIKVSYGLPCNCENFLNCGCQNVMQLPQLPVLNPPCGCQGCQSPVELPVYDFSCQSLPPPVIGCSGKYLRQVTLPPPFL